MLTDIGQMHSYEQHIALTQVLYLEARLLDEERGPALSEHRFALYTWKLCRVA
jgi:hypothetical protein